MGLGVRRNVKLLSKNHIWPWLLINSWLLHNCYDQFLNYSQLLSCPGSSISLSKFYINRALLEQLYSTMQLFSVVSHFAILGCVNRVAFPTSGWISMKFWLVSPSGWTEITLSNLTFHLHQVYYLISVGPILSFITKYLQNKWHSLQTSDSVTSLHTGL